MTTGNFFRLTWIFSSFPSRARFLSCRPGFELKIPAFWTHRREITANVKLPPAAVTAFRAAKEGAAGPGNWPPAGWVSAPEAVPALKIGNCKVGAEPESMTCPVSVEAKLPTTDNYLFRIDVPLGSDRGMNWDAWSFDQNQAGDLAALKKSFKTGRGRTRNFEMMVSGLLTVVSNDPPPLAARAYLVVHSK